MQMLVPRYLETSIDSLTREQQKFRDQMSQAFGVSPFGALDEQVRRNMEVFQRAFSMFTPFARRDEENGEAEKPATSSSSGSSGDLDELKRQLDDMRKKVERLSNGDK
jgi:polyhydroxyalkanoate synthesis regulator protein